MIFAHTLPQVICGEKWQTRRLVKPGESLDESNRRVRSNNLRTVYEIGKTYAVQPNRGKKAVARIMLTAVRRERVAVISEQDALAEGFTSRDAFIAAWRTIHGKESDLTREVWVLEFRLHTVMADAIQRAYGRDTNRRTDHSYDVPPSLQRLSGIGLYSGHHTDR